MPQRFLRPGITNSDRWNSCSWGAQSFFVRLLTIVDDYGRYDGRHILLKSHAFPISEKVSLAQISDWCDELSQKELVTFYEVDGKEYLQIVRWQERARTNSRFPAPPGEIDLGAPSGKIYFIRAESSKKIKIGFTQFKIETRLSVLQTGSPEVLKLLVSFDGTPQEERELHQRFKSDNTGGEWFNESRELLDYLATRSNCAQKGASLALVPRHRTSPSTIASSNGTKESSPQSDEEWLDDLIKDKTYDGIDVRREHGKMLQWCSVRRKQPTRRRFVNWLNGSERPINSKPTKADYKRNYLPPSHEPTEEELAAQRKIAHDAKEKLKTELHR